MNKENDVISHKTMLNILNDLSPFRYAYVYGFVIVFCVPLLFGSHFSDYLGFTPFSQSMKLASGRVRLLSDSVMLYFIVIFIAISLTYLLKGLSDEVVMEFKRAARNPHRIRDRQVENPQRTIFFTALFLIFINILWVWVFTFTSIGNSKIMSNILNDSEFFVVIYILFGFLANLYLFIYSFLMMEGRKHVVFIRKS